MKFYEDYENYENEELEDNEPTPTTLDDWMHYNGLSWSDFI